MYLYCCIWYNTWCWTYQVNWEHTRMVFIWSRFLLLVLLDRSNFCQGQFRLCKMKSVSVVEVYTTNFSCTLMSIEENHPANNICLKFFYLGFILFLHFNIQWSKLHCYTWSCLFNLQPTQKLYILLFLEGYASAYFKLINFWISRPNSSMEGD